VPGRSLSRDFYLVTAANFVFFLNFASFFLLPLHLKELGVTERTIGYVMGTAGFAGLCILPFLGTLLDRVGRRSFVTAGALTMALASFAYIAVPGVGPLLFLLRVVQGVSFTSAFVTASTLAVELAPIERRGEALGLFGISTLTTHAIAPALGEVVARRFVTPAARPPRRRPDPAHSCVRAPPFCRGQCRRAAAHGDPLTGAAMMVACAWGSGPCSPSCRPSCTRSPSSTWRPSSSRTRWPRSPCGSRSADSPTAWGGGACCCPRSRSSPWPCWCSAGCTRLRRWCASGCSSAPGRAWSTPPPTRSWSTSASPRTWGACRRSSAEPSASALRPAPSSSAVIERFGYPAVYRRRAIAVGGVLLWSSPEAGVATVATAQDALTLVQAEP
jgi:hypothetical protein